MRNSAVLFRGVSDDMTGCDLSCAARHVRRSLGEGGRAKKEADQSISDTLHWRIGLFLIITFIMDDKLMKKKRILLVFSCNDTRLFENQILAASI
jgi:hypothetical protein